jgi:hypothetical protein
MTPENKTKILEALRYGGFKQARHRLVGGHISTVDSYCCVAVAAVALGGKFSMQHSCPIFQNYFNPITLYAGKFAGLDKVELSQTALEYLKEHKVEAAADWVDMINVMVELNDIYNWNFDQIADFLEVAL